MRGLLAGIIGLGMLICLAGPAKADHLEALVFAGYAACQDHTCAAYGSGPVTGAYNFDVTTGNVFGAWSFTLPFATISSTDVGGVNFGTGGEFELFADETATLDQAIAIQFLPLDPTELGAINSTNFIPSTACINNTDNPGKDCVVDYLVSGSISLAGSGGSGGTGGGGTGGGGTGGSGGNTVPEPASVVLLTAGLAAAIAIKRIAA